MQYLKISGRKVRVYVIAKFLKISLSPIHYFNKFLPRKLRQVARKPARKTNK